MIVDAHYDSVFNAPGADDNASGVAGVLEALEILKDYSFERSIKFIAFDLEEEGLKGSVDYATKAVAESEDIMGVINFEMIGYHTEQPNSQSFPFGFELLFPDAYGEIEENDFKGDFITNVGTENLPNLMMCYDSIAEIYVPELSVISVASPGNGTIVPDLQRSDHAPFWFAGYDAIMLSDGAEFRNPNYHMASDSLHLLDMNFAANIVKAAVATLIDKSGIVHGDIYFPENLLILSNEDVSDCENPLYYFTGTELLSHQNTCAENSKQVRLFTLDGRIVLDIQENFEKIDVQRLDKGIYILEVQGERKTWKQKILINR
jgi:Zn-dependent M28 family amino/carboxypeptidase